MLKGSHEVVGDKMRVQVEVPLPPERAAVKREAAKDVSEKGRAGHTPDFATVHWYGETYTFAPTQQLVVGNLWAAWKEGDGSGAIDEATLLEDADSFLQRLRDVFDHGRHPAWGTMIVQAIMRGGPRGAYMLNVPAGGEG